MAKIEIYTRPGCGYCTHAKQLLTAKGLTFSEYDVYLNPQHASTLRSRTANRSYPQLFINQLSIGGFDQLLMLAQQDRLPTAAENR